MRETLRSLEEGKALGAEATYAAFEMEAHALFLDQVAALIRKVAGKHAQQVRVVRERSVAWLDYTGEDQSDMPLEFMVTMVAKGATVVAHVSGSRAGRSYPDQRYELPSGVMTPRFVATEFVKLFGTVEVP